MTDIRNLNARAVRQSVDIVNRVQVTDLGRPTPCSAWDLADLLGHMTVQHVGFAAAARGDGADPARWKFAPAGDDAVERYAAAAEDVLAAYAALDSLDAELLLPEFAHAKNPPSFPAAQAIGFHFIDYVVHGWDVARTLGLEYRLDEELAEPALRVALAVPGGQSRLREGAAFGPALGGTPDGSTASDAPSESALDQILRHLGRSPSWPQA